MPPSTCPHPDPHTRILTDPHTSTPKVTVKKISKPVSTLILVLPGSTVTSSKHSSTEERRMRNNMQYSNDLQYTTWRSQICEDDSIPHKNVPVLVMHAIKTISSKEAHYVSLVLKERSDHIFTLARNILNGLELDSNNRETPSIVSCSLNSTALVKRVSNGVRGGREPLPSAASPVI